MTAFFGFLLITETFLPYSSIRRKRLWIGTEHDGLYRWAEGVQPVHLVNGQHVSSIFEDSSHNIWIGTWSGGIFLFDNKGTVRNIRCVAIR